MNADASLATETRLAAAEELLACYTSLAERGEHLLAPLLEGAAPVQWEHYPFDDVIDAATGFQYFYHSHDPAERPDAPEHGHFHLFARMDGAHGLDAMHEAQFLDSLSAAPAADTSTAGLLCIGLDAKGVARSLFTVNRWVTGDHLLSADASLALLRQFRISGAGTPIINRWLAAMIGLFWPHIEALLRARDRKLHSMAGTDALLEDPAIEVLSLIEIDIDCQLGLLAETA